ncbi:protein MALE DISCOVERER 2-like [Nymphaea colorata]|nr:protein MALE DISCOVERER 2-like [Nymphaea colorata]XP_031495765.1 protein MALE DISCOVERER 2-like [Nymphaea colorata]XP_031495766.1 protein MALE DISCOVERER 2-like [Nymphaea colorata]
MGGRGNLFGFPLRWIILVVLTFLFKIKACCSLNLEGLALLEFRARVDSDPYGALSNWDPNDDSPCMWSGVLCRDDKVHILNLSEFALGGSLAPEIGKLSNMRALILYKNNFQGIIPKEIGELRRLEFLDLRHNRLSGQIPTEIRNMSSLKRLLLCNNSFEDGLSPELLKLCIHLESQVDKTLTTDFRPQADFMSKRLSRSLSDGNEGNRQALSSEGKPCKAEHMQYLLTARRKLLEVAVNLPAAPNDGGQISADVPSLSSGSFKAHSPASEGISSSPPPSSSSPVPGNDSSQKPSSPPSKESDSSSEIGQQAASKWVYTVALPGVVVTLVLCLALLFMCRSRGVATIGPWKSGLSGQLQKAFVTGAPKLNRAELETACEDFSNIIGTLPDCTIFKGTLSSGVEIAVTSAAATSTKDWSKCSELYFRKKIDTLSRLNHKNLVNLLGYCIEDEPFTRMMVFEYAPNGTLFEHLHVQEVEHLDWSARMRIVMGVAYCLQYMHHDLSPPVAHPNLHSTSIYLTDDFAAKLADFSYWKAPVEKAKTCDDDLEQLDWPYKDLESNIYNFGILLLEIISGKLPYSEEQGFLVNWAVDYLNDKRSISYMIDPTLKSFKNNELDAICEVIQQCIHPDTKQRPTMKEVTTKLRDVLSISPEAATPRLSPLWWAELEILSVEAS